MEFGLSTACMYPEILEQVIECYGKLGVSQLEIFFNTFSELSKEYVRELKKRVDFYGMTVCSVHPFTSGLEPLMLFSEYERRVGDMLELYKRFFEAMQFLEAKVFVFHGDNRANERNAALYAERYQKLYRCGKEYGVIVAQENIVRCKSGDLDFLKELKCLLGKEIAFVFDIKQAVRSGYDPMEVLQVMGDQTVHLHLNDHLPGKDCLLPGCGRFDFSGCIRYLREIGNIPTMVVEVYHNNYKLPIELAESLKFLFNICDC